jgi:TatD family-associated radical SAM protein
VYGEGNLWLEKDPTASEVIEEFRRFDFEGYEELIYCGYGEPTCAIDVLLESAKYFKEHYPQKIRINTNGLGSLYNKRDILPELNQVADSYSISLNAPDKKRYNEVSRPKWENSFEEMIRFATEAHTAGKEVCLSVVTYIEEEEISRCKDLAKKLGIPLKIREYEV